MGISRQEYWSDLSFLSAGNLPNPEIKARPPVLQADSLPSEPPESRCLPMQERGFDLWIRKIPWQRAWQPTPGFLPGESHGQRGLIGYSPWNNKRVRNNLKAKQEQKNQSPNKVGERLFLDLRPRLLSERSWGRSFKAWLLPVSSGLSISNLGSHMVEKQLTFLPPGKAGGCLAELPEGPSYL